MLNLLLITDHFILLEYGWKLYKIQMRQKNPSKTQVNTKKNHDMIILKNKKRIFRLLTHSSVK